MDDISSVWFRPKFPSSSSSYCTTVGEISYPIPPAIVMAIMTSTVKLVSLTHLRCSNFVRPALIRICSRTIEGQETWKGCQPSFTLLSMISRTWTSSFVKFHGTLAINLSKPLALVSFSVAQASAHGRQSRQKRKLLENWEYFLSVAREPTASRGFPADDWYA